jgi:hypothetical protein
LLQGKRSFPVPVDNLDGRNYVAGLRATIETRHAAPP